MAVMLPELVSLSEAVRELAQKRFCIIQPFLEKGVPLRVLAREHGIPYRTAQHWAMLYRNFGLAALGRRGRSDRGGHRGLSSKILEIIEALALQKPSLPVAVIQRQASQIALDLGQKAPSYRVVRAVVKTIPPDLLALAHEGKKAYSETFELVCRREADRPNAIWQADHSLLDILIRCETEKPVKNVKPWLTIIIDDYSRAIAGYYLSFEPPTAAQTALALRQAIWRKQDPRWQVCGIPDVLYTDNGRDFTSRHIEQVCADLKIQLIFSTPGAPRGRGRIERFFETVNQMFLCELPGYAPVGSGVREKPSLTMPELDGLLSNFLLDVYHRRQHAETNLTPGERWEKGGFLPRMPDSLEQLDLLLLAVAGTRKIHSDGIRFQGLRYVDLTLAAYVGETVTLRFDPRDIAEVRVFHREKFLCRAICAELAGTTIPLREILGARNRRRRELQTLLRDRKKTVDELLELKNGSGKTGITENLIPAPKQERPLKRYRNE